MADGAEGQDGQDKKRKIKPGSFAGLGLSQATCRAVMKMGYNMPTPIQRRTIPTIIDGQDVVAMARTGSGKTAAFLIPIIERLANHSQSVGFRALTLSPTRELAMQTATFFRKLGRFANLRCCLLVGGQAMEAQFEHLANNPDVVIACPGRLAHHLVEAEISLSRVEVLVFDEADRLFELGFAEQLQQILDGTPQSRQCLLFSATMPAQLVSFSRAGIKDPVFVRLDVETTLSDNLDLWYLYIRQDEKIAAAISILKFLSKSGNKSTIMFVATRHHVEFFGELLRKIGMPTSIVYGNMVQQARTENVESFRRKRTQVLVTTDVAARGIDVPLLDYVVNYDFPPSGKLFVHRAGRTARAGRSGLAISLVTLTDLPYTVELQLFLGRKMRVADFDRASVDKWKSHEDGGEIGVPLLGAMPSLEGEMEALAPMLEEEGSDLVSLHKSMLSSYHLYNKTRPSASRESVARAKQLLEECGGPARMQSLIHPAFVKAGWGSAAEPRKKAVASKEEEAALIQHLRRFRPKSEKIGNVLSVGAMRTMEMAKMDITAITHAARLAPGQVEESILVEKPDLALPDLEWDGPDSYGVTSSERKAKKGKKRKAQPAKQQDAPKEAPKARNAPRMSKRARQQAKTGGPSSSAPAAADDDEDGGDFDVKVDGVDVGKSAMSGSRGGKNQKETAKQFYLSVDKDATEDAKERGLDMEKYQLDLMPDDDKDIMRAKSVIRWDAKKKKYMPIMVAADGRALRSQRRDEAGNKVKGDKDKTSLYKKWATNTKKRIQKVGEIEQRFSKAQTRAEIKEAAVKARETTTVEFDDQANEIPAEERKRKPVVPFYGEIPEENLTHSQKRRLGRRKQMDKTGVTRAGKGVKGEVRSADQMQSHIKKKQKARLKNNPHARHENGQKVKAQREEKRMDNQQQYGARTKAKMLIFEGHKKIHKRKAGHGRGMPSI